MADIHVRSTDGSDSDNGSTWALSKATGAGAAAIDAAGDNVYFSQAHAESSASSITWAWAGTAASPTRVVGVSDAAEPPTSQSTKPTITTTGSTSLTATGVAYYENLKFVIGSGAVNPTISLVGTGNTVVRVNNCAMELVGTGGNGRIHLADSNNSLGHYLNCLFKFGGTGQSFSVAQSGRSRAVIQGGGLDSGTSAITKLVVMTDSAELLITSFDASAGASSMNIFGAGVNGGRGVIADSKLPASWTGSLTTGTLVQNERYSLYNCDNGNTNYKLLIVSYGGNVIQETTLVKTGGATDGTTPISWKCVTTANADDLGNMLQTDWMVVWNETTGSSKTVTVDILHDSATNLTDGDIWLEVEELGTSGCPLGVVVSDQRSTIVTAAADQASSSATWTTTGMSNPNKQKLEATFTPQLKGWVRCRVNGAKASYTFYVDCEPVLS